MGYAVNIPDDKPVKNSDSLNKCFVYKTIGADYDYITYMAQGGTLFKIDIRGAVRYNAKFMGNSDIYDTIIICSLHFIKKYVINFCIPL